MSLVGRVGRKRLRARLAMALLYVVLSVGAVTTLYPFAIMITSGMKGPTDQNDTHFIPAYFNDMDSKSPDGSPDPSSLYSKYLNDKYSGDASQIASTRIGGDSATANQYAEFLETLPVDQWSAGFKTAPNQVTGRLAAEYQAWLRAKYSTIEALNIAYIEENTAFQTISVPAELLERFNWKPRDSRKYCEWLEFKATLPAEFRIPVRRQRLWQEFQRAKCENQFDRVASELKGTATKFEELSIPEQGTDFDEFLAKMPTRFASASTEDRWAHFVKKPGEPMPIDRYERDFINTNRSARSREFATRNYAYVLDYVALHGRALWNTAIFCLLAILAQLTVNPLAAYALSRFPIRASGKILLFLLATMAFPAEVAMIPSFLLLKDLGLLNTFAALVLPTAASGYMIFLLKGFFDSLPPELFESGQIDGAREGTMMMRIAFPLSKPVMGYLSLMAFMGAYGAFLYAFLVAQDQRVWTLMVFVYQLQGSAPKAVMMAALTLVALPTLLVFLFAQRTIMRGIILPGEK